MWLAVEVRSPGAAITNGCLQIGTPPLLSKAEIDNVLSRIVGYGPPSEMNCRYSNSFGPNAAA